MEIDFGVCDRQTDRQWHIVFCSHLFAMYSEHESGPGFTSPIPREKISKRSPRTNYTVKGNSKGWWRRGKGPHVLF